MADLIAEEYRTFERIKHTDEDGAESWFARDLQDVLQYTQWRNFQKVIDRAMLACKNSGFVVTEHFAEVSKTIKMPKTIELGTTLPENLPTPAKSIQTIEREELRKLRNSAKPLMLDE